MRSAETAGAVCKYFSRLSPDIFIGSCCRALRSTVEVDRRATDHGIRYHITTRGEVIIIDVANTGIPEITLAFAPKDPTGHFYHADTYIAFVYRDAHVGDRLNRPMFAMAAIDVMKGKTSGLRVAHSSLTPGKWNTYFYSRRINNSNGLDPSVLLRDGSTNDPFDYLSRECSSLVHFDQRSRQITGSYRTSLSRVHFWAPRQIAICR